MNDPTTLIMELVHWQKKLAKLSTIWGSITLSVDATICLFMIIILFSSRDSVFHKETRIFTRVISLTFETMLPPVIILVILLSLYGKSSTPMSDVRQVMICALPPLYYNSALHTLVGRRSVRRILDAKLAADGVRMLSGQFHGDSSSQTLYRKGGGAHSPFIHAGVVENTGDIEEYQKMTMFGGKGKMGMTPPMISVETSTFISEPDRRAEQKRSVNRGWVEDDLDDISEASVSADIKEEALTPELTEPIISIEMIARSCASDDLVVHPGRY
ncbi:hypothetical protein B9479_000162 [Cryptococcus floricola]|uniref:DUF6534 domain-containing protein n=1 Tax=Cryptococcus floricola TaxID=2591691 RepID=A0A5D3BAN2_9TREE|nr:hypothetical protein B9479_000162 [Cryptococcus floricola]